MSETTAVTDGGETLAFVGKKPCGCYCYAAVIGEHLDADIFEELADLMRGGMKIEIKPVQWVRDGGLNFDCPHQPQPKAIR
jgi:hypothetical protein